MLLDGDSGTMGRPIVLSGFPGGNISLIRLAPYLKIKIQIVDLL
jgi:hypothetical protein